MPCIDDEQHTAPLSGAWTWVAVSLACGFATLGLVGCGSTGGASSPTPAPAPVTSPAMAPVPAPQAPVGPAPAKSWNEFKLYAARKVVAANPQITHTGKVQQPALAIPVLEVELNGDGSVRHIDVMRQPSQARDTTQLAIDAVKRAGPFGSVAHLPKPWKFSESFLFNDERKFKPASLDR